LPSYSHFFDEVVNYFKEEQLMFSKIEGETIVMLARYAVTQQSLLKSL
jgi:hypothetical protein